MARARKGKGQKAKKGNGPAKLLKRMISDKTWRGLQKDAHTTSKRTAKASKFIKLAKATRKHVDVVGVDTAGGWLARGLKHKKNVLWARKHGRK